MNTGNYPKMLTKGKKKAKGKKAKPKTKKRGKGTFSTDS